MENSLEHELSFEDASDEDLFDVTFSAEKRFIRRLSEFGHMAECENIAAATKTFTQFGMIYYENELARFSGRWWNNTFSTNWSRFSSWLGEQIGQLICFTFGGIALLVGMAGESLVSVFGGFGFLIVGVALKGLQIWKEKLSKAK